MSEFNTQGFKVLSPKYFEDKVNFSEYKHNDDYLVRYRKGMKVIFVSHRWLVEDDPDPLGVQFLILKNKINPIVRTKPEIINKLTESFSLNLGDMKMFVKTATGLTITISVGESTKIKDILDIIDATTEGSNALLFCGKQLSPNLTISQYNIKPESTLHLIKKTTEQKYDNLNYIWYDYACFPQKPRTKDEEDFFQWNLYSLELLIRNCDEFIILNPNKGFFDRGWCLFETTMYIRKYLINFIEQVLNQQEVETAINNCILSGDKKISFDLDRLLILYKYVKDNQEIILIDPESAMSLHNISCTNGSDFRFLIKKTFSARTDILQMMCIDIS